MSGTSFDGIDLSFLETDGKIIYRYLGDLFYEYPSSLIKKYHSYQEFKLYDLLSFEREVTAHHLNAIERFCAKHELAFKEVDLIGFHGQTLLHCPEKKLTFQAGNPHILTSKLGIDVIADFRRRDIEDGGEGAPLTPYYHQSIIDSSKYPAAVINIGGVSNVTLLDHGSLDAFDLGPGNAPLNDFIAHASNSAQIDLNGTISSQGTVDHTLVNKILTDNFFALRGPKSLDRNFISWERFKHLTLSDGAATICYLIAKAISLIDLKNRNVFICGGGRKNPTIMKFITELCSGSVFSIDHIIDKNLRNINGDFIESQAFAFLAARIKLGLPIADLNTTGTKYLTSGGAFYRA